MNILALVDRFATVVESTHTIFNDTAEFMRGTQNAAAMAL
jgi:hypothetical protein